uniref:CHCH domain-containing protein n=1 Tax=Minutocellus polymorphus TaxID=265543 RepID=A0A6U0LMW1_9STRA|mmetsp:Transcript_9432/g.15653  ORF Transcript_9432/g.15653 Transcript_9432/m.15653 type:complete len:114 (+) Transcript_9432:72-413(+)
MASMNFSSGKQFVKPPQRGIFPLDHDAECKPKMQKYLECLKEEKQQHNKCRELSKDYLQCRMDNELMAKENLDEMGFSENARITEAKEYDKSKEKEGYVAGKHIKGKLTGWLW